MSGTMPRLDEVWSKLGGCRVFSALDLPEGFYQFYLREEDRPKTAFTDQDGAQWQWLVCPFGLRNVPHWCQAFMNKVAGETMERMKEAGVEGIVVVWMDDVLVATPTEAAHKGALRLLFEVSAAHRVKYKLDFSKMACSEVVWCGFQVSEKGRKVATPRVDLEHWDTPTTRSQIQHLTGWCQWSAQDHPRLHILLQPFYAALSGDQQIPDLQEPMATLKEALRREDEWLAFPQLGAHLSYTLMPV